MEKLLDWRPGESPALNLQISVQTFRIGQLKMAAESGEREEDGREEMPLENALIEEVFLF